MIDIPLMEVDSDQRLKLPPLNFGEGLGRHLDQVVQNLLEVVVSGLHDLAIGSGVLEGISCTYCPDDLNPQESNLKREQAHASDQETNFTFYQP